MATWNWRLFFDPAIVDAAVKQKRAGFISRFSINRSDGLSATAEFSMGYRTKCRVPQNYTQCMHEFRITPETPPEDIRYMSRQFFSCNCSDSQDGPCIHEACLLIHWEKERGSFSFRETSEEKVQREAEEAKQQAAAARGAVSPTLQRKAELVRPQLPDLSILKPDVPVAPVFEDIVIPEHLYYDPRPVLKYTASQDAVSKALLMSMQENSLGITAAEETFRGGKRMISFKLASPVTTLRFDMTHEGLQKCSCSMCHITWSRSKTSTTPALCHHLLAGLRLVVLHLVHKRPGDATTQGAQDLMNYISDRKRASALPPLPESVELSLMLYIEDFALSASGRPPVLFSRLRIGRNAWQEYDRPLLLPAMVRDRQPLPRIGSSEVDFSRVTVSAASRGILRLLDDMRGLQERERRSMTYFSRSLPDGAAELTGTYLDMFYDFVQNGDIIPCLNQERAVIGMLQAGSQEGLIRLVISLTEADDQPVLMMEGEMPLILQGARYDYVYTKNPPGLLRLQREDMELIARLRGMSSSEHRLECLIGQNQMVHFVHDILPVLRETKIISLRDCTPDSFLQDVPASAVPSFYLTKSRQAYRCRIVMDYAGKEYTLPYLDNFPPMQDSFHEYQAVHCVQRFFPDLKDTEQQYCCSISDDNLYRILHDGVPELERLGRVYASQDFPDLHLKKLSSVYFSVDSDSNLLELSMISDDFTEEELLEIFAAYQQKEHYHRLRSGDFIDMDKAEEQLSMIQSLSQQLDVDIADLIQKKTLMPRARAFLLESMLARHENLFMDRDHVVDRMIRDFDSARKVPWEVPASLAGIMRPYQVMGYRWLRLLAAGGFGGILADDMGLGKTIQMLSLLLALHQEGTEDPFLIVCPASLVYNWKEEIRRFTPELSAITLTGPAPVREALLTPLKEGRKEADIYIASYDICRRDIFHLQAIHFNVVVLDEAQYIKTTHAGITKSVKILQADHRFALTGTPIENRLSELWSIFDFLMPGFLFSARTFRDMYDVPISQFRDPETTEMLARMTAPFILRRLKSDVLSDLPEKLEEVRTAVLGPEQRIRYDAEVASLKQLLTTVKNASDNRFQILAHLTRLRQVCCDPSLLYEDFKGESAKRSACMDLIESAIDGGHRLLVFSQFTSMLDLLQKDLADKQIPYFVLTGSTPKEERVRMVHDFNVGDTPVFLISLKAGGTGLNLVGADVVIHYDPWWNLAAQNQATDRAHRIGQQKQVTVFKLIAAGTIEERILELQEKKKDLADAILEGRSESLLNMSREDLMRLIS